MPSRFVLAQVLALAMVGCGASDGSGAPPDSDASTVNDAPTTPDDGAARSADAHAEAATCNGPIANSGPQANEVAVASGAPAPSGGTVRDGLYALTKWTLFTGSGGQSGTQSRTLMLTLRVTGTTWEFAIRENGGTLDYGTQTVTYAGSSFTASLYCPPPSEAKAAAGYTASASELRIYDSTIDSAGMSELRLTRQ